MSIDGPTAAHLRQAYDDDGFVIVEQVIDADRIAEVAAHVGWLQARHPELRGEDLGHDLMTDDPFWVDLVRDERLADLAEVFLGPDLAVFASHYISKPPRSGRPVLWHQDAAFWPLEPMAVVSLWLAVDAATPENGCLRVVPGSHRAGVHARRAVTDVDSVFGDTSDIELAPDVPVRDIVLRPGDVEIHDPNILHSSGPNLSPMRRCGLTIRYIPTTTRIVTDEAPYASAFHVRGALGVNRYQPVPAFDHERHFAAPSTR